MRRLGLVLFVLLIFAACSVNRQRNKTEEVFSSEQGLNQVDTTASKVETNTKKDSSATEKAKDESTNITLGPDAHLIKKEFYPDGTLKSQIELKGQSSMSKKASEKTKQAKKQESTNRKATKNTGKKANAIAKKNVKKSGEALNVRKSPHTGRLIWILLLLLALILELRYRFIRNLFKKK